MNELNKHTNPVTIGGACKIAFFLILMMTNLANGMCQARKDIIIYGKLNHQLKEKLQGELKLEVYIDLIATDSNVNKAYPVKVSGDNFKIIIKPKTDVQYLVSKLLPANWSFIMAQPGDSLYFDLKSEDNYTFNSNNKYLFDCQLELKKANVPVARTFMTGDTGIVNYLNFKRDSILKGLDHILSKYKQLLKPEIINLLKINFYSLVNTAYCSSVGVMAQDHESNYAANEIKLAAAALNARYVHSRPPNDSQLIKNSIFYVPYLLALEKAWNGLQSDTGNFRQDRFDRMFISINRNYTGVLKQKVLTLFFLTCFNQSYSAIDSLNSILPEISDQSYQIMLAGMQVAKTSGNNAYPFKLIGEDGKIYSLDDFKDKLIICKFWFTGCIACIREENILKPLREKYKNNQKVVFISINVDYTKERWEQGLKLGTYTSSQSINLATFNSGFHHPMLEFYHYVGFPQLLLIDKTGKIITSSPEQPTDNSSLSSLDTLIQSHL
jgi:thiol-disulfide isomerase/thioredoxin